LIFVVVAVILLGIRDFGAPRRPGSGLPSESMQALFVPVMAVAFAAAPVAGQNFGAGRRTRVKGDVSGGPAK